MKFVSVESGIGWIPFFLESLDYQLGESAPSVGRRAVDAAVGVLPAPGVRRASGSSSRMLEPVIDALGVRPGPVRDRLPAPHLPVPRPARLRRGALAGAGRRREAGRAPGQRRRALSRGAADAYTSLTGTTLVGGGRASRRGGTSGTRCGRAGGPRSTASSDGRGPRAAITIVHEPSGSYVICAPLIVTCS